MLAILWWMKLAIWVGIRGFKRIVGTVAYIGPICLSKPTIEWIGVIWDKEGRGKNNGTLTDSNGVHHYFSCSDRQGSFVHAEKLQKCYTMREAYMHKFIVFIPSNK